MEDMFGVEMKHGDVVQLRHCEFDGLESIAGHTTAELIDGELYLSSVVVKGSGLELGMMPCSIFASQFNLVVIRKEEDKLKGIKPNYTKTSFSYKHE